ncbi:MAG: hypothetical protein BRC36_14565 [Cyanobacteria bacterium QH_2_48_84]|nr:MAG: hypothetical protein BRC36_14565 [Cyanobacteria bacterium QH_2_48_84]
MNTFVETLRWFVILSGELIALFLGVSFLVGLLQAWVPEQRIRKILERRHAATSYITGTALGAITPFCSCSTIPLVAGLLSSGAPFGPTMSFLVASPLLNPVILALLMVAIGVLGTLIYAVITFLAAIGIGVLWTKMGLKSDVKRVRVRGGKSLTDSSKGSVWRRAWNQAWSFFVPMVPYLLLGTAVGALIYGYVPEDWILTVAGPDQPFAVPLAAVIGVPIYIRAETIIPIAQALLAKGMGTGAVVALIIGGAGASIPEVSLLTGLFRLRLVVAFVASIFTVAISSGITFSVFTT